MEIVNIDYSSIHYPVGRNMARNIPAIKSIYNSFKQLEELPTDRAIDIVVVGTSGSIVASLFAVMIIADTGRDVRVLVLDKPDEDSGRGDISWMCKGNYLLFVDDMIEYGNTILKLIQQIRDHSHNTIECFDAVCVGGNVSSEVLKIMDEAKVTKKIFCKVYER